MLSTVAAAIIGSTAAFAPAALRTYGRAQGRCHTHACRDSEESVMAGERRQFVSYFRQLSRAEVMGGQVAFTVLTCPDRTSARQ
jgi:hypothetical protein